MSEHPSTTPRARAVADRMLDVAVERISREGMTVGLDHVRMEEVIAAAGVSRASAYRRWPRREDFLADVLVAVVRRTTLVPEGPEDIARLLALIETARPRLTDPQVRRDLVVEGLRVSVDADVRRILASPAFRTYLSVSATCAGLADDGVRTAVSAALARTEADFTARRAGVYANLAVMIGYRPVEPGAVEALASAAGMLMSGIQLRAIARPEWLDERIEARLFGQSAPAAWSMPERHVVGCVLAHLEPDPDAAWDDAAVATRLGRMAETIAELYAQPSRPLDASVPAPD